MLRRLGWLRALGLRDRKGMRPRPWVQLGMAAVTILIGVRFYLFVEQFRSGMPETVAFSRPAGVEAFLPIGALVALKAWLTSGWWDTVHPAALTLLLAFLAISFLIKRGFCSWICPIGLLSESLAKLGRWFFGRNLKPPRWLDLLLMAPKYLILAFFLQAIWLGMPGETARWFLATPYYQFSDIKLLQFFLSPSLLTVQVLLVLAVLSVLIEGFWCRYLCPYGALLGLVSVISPTVVTRDAAVCTNCRACDRVCPSRIKVSQAATVRSPECHACLNCVEACPLRTQGALVFGVPGSSGRLRLGRRAYAAVIVGLLVLAMAAGRMAGRWETSLTARDYGRLVPAVEYINH